MWPGGLSFQEEVLADTTLFLTGVHGKCVLGLVNVCISHSQNHPRDGWALGNARNSKQSLHHDSGAQELEEVRVCRAWNMVSVLALYLLAETGLS